MHVFSNKSQMSSKCDKNGKVTHNAQPSVSLYESFKFLKPMPCPHGRANTRIKSINLSDIFSLFMYLRLILSNSANTRKKEWYRTSLWAFFFCVYYCNTSTCFFLKCVFWLLKSLTQILDKILPMVCLDHDTGRYFPFFLRKVRGFFNVPR